MANKIEFFRGDGHTISLTVTQNNSVLDLTGYTVWFTVKKRKNDADEDALITKEVTEHSDPTAGETAIILTKEDTDVLTGNHHYDIQIQSESGDPLTVSGTCQVKQDITQASN